MGWLWDSQLPFGTLKGLTLTSVVNSGDEIVFFAADGRRFHLYHDQECCESVYVDDVVGDLDFLVGTPILMADEVSSDDAPPPPGGGGSMSRSRIRGRSISWALSRAT